jgi:hypothetical protein
MNGMRKQYLIIILVVVMSLLPLKQAAAADFNIHLHLYTVEGKTVGEISFGEQIAFRMHVASGDATPVVTMSQGSSGGIISPDITNGMFLLRFSKND